MTIDHHDESLVSAGMTPPRHARVVHRLRPGIATVLLADAGLHAFWLTGATWPARNEFALSVAVLGFGAPFGPRVLLGLIVCLVLLAAAIMVRTWTTRVWLRGLSTTALTLVTAASLVRGLLGVLWMIPTTGYLHRDFYWLNAFLYTPLCLALAGAGLTLLRPGDAHRRQGRPVTRLLAVCLPVVLIAIVLYGAYGVSPTIDTSYRPSQGMGGVASRYVDTSMARFHYLRIGHGPAVVLLSPGASWVSAWLPEAKALSAEHTVYVVDLPGQGFTTLYDRHFTFDLQHMTAAIGIFLQAVGVHHTALGGNSWSGGWALTYTQQHPDQVSSLMLLAPSGVDRRDPISWEILKLPVIGRALTNVATSKSSVTAEVRSLFVHKDRATPGIIDGMYAVNTRPDNVRSMYELEARLDWAPVEAKMRQTKTPTLVIWGWQDSVLPASDARVFERRLPHASVAMLNGCGHALTLDCPTRASELMARFLRGH